MNKTKKLFLAVATVALIAPSIALAAWYNPLSWFNHWGMGAVDFPETVVVEKSTVPVAKPAMESRILVKPDSEKTVAPTQHRAIMYQEILRIDSDCGKKNIPYTKEYYTCFVSGLTIGDCENIKTQENYNGNYSMQVTQNRCFEAFADSKGDVSICKNLTDVITTKTARLSGQIALCINAMAFRKGDEKLCDSMPSVKEKSQCVLNVRKKETQKIQKPKTASIVPPSIKTFGTPIEIQGIGDTANPKAVDASIYRPVYTPVPFTLNENPTLDAAYASYYEISKEVVNYSIKVSSTQEVKGIGRGYLIHTTIENIQRSPRKGSVTMMNVKCSGGIEVSMLFSGDVCKKKYGQPAEFSVDTSTKIGSGDQGLIVKGKGTVYAEVLVSFIPEDFSGNTLQSAYTPQVILHKGVTFEVN